MRIWPAAFLALVCSALATVAAGQQTASSPLPVVQVPPATPSFPEWLAAVRAEAISRGIRAETVDGAFTDLEPVPTVLERDRNQAELTLTLDQYLTRRLTRSMIRTAQRVSRQHARLLARVSAKYGVPAGVVVAVWGLESNFGRFSGVRPTIATLATLAYDQRRGAMFREELFNALLILESGDVEAAALRGSWAGALGQPQFMPSSFLQYAQDFDGDGKRDIWKSTPDVFASIANYLSAHGWNSKQTWGREVKLPPGLSGDALREAAPLQATGCLAQRQMTIRLPLAKWSELGVKTATGTALPRASIDAALVSAGRRHFLLYPNYDAVLSYNCVHAYGLSVALLSDRLR
jgi:membrane-bound lytic murein transglycosylase B